MIEEKQAKAYAAYLAAEAYRKFVLKRRIIDGKLHLGKMDKESGEAMSITDARDRMGAMSTVRKIEEDIREIKERARTLTP